MTFSGSKSKINLKGSKTKDINGVVLGLIDSNSLRNKFEQLCEFCKENLDIILITET